MSMRRETAETLALQALGWIAAEEDLMPVFLGASGIGLDDLRARAGEPEVLAAVLDFLLMDDAWVTSCAATLGTRPEQLWQARQALPGGGEVHWT